MTTLRSARSKASSIFLMNQQSELLYLFCSPASSFSNKRSNVLLKRQDSTAIQIIASRIASGGVMICSVFVIFSLSYSKNLFRRHLITDPHSSSTLNKSSVERGSEVSPCRLCKNYLFQAQIRHHFLQPGIFFLKLFQPFKTTLLSWSLSRLSTVVRQRDCFRGRSRQLSIYRRELFPAIQTSVFCRKKYAYSIRNG